MAAIDLIVLGMLKKEEMGAYDIQKQVEYRNISKWVKISTPSVYKKVIQLEEKGFITSRTEKDGKMPEKAVYSLTKEGEKEFERLMSEISCAPVNIFLDINAVIVNIDSLSKKKRRGCIENIEKNVLELKRQLEENIEMKEDNKNIPAAGMAVMRQQYALALAIEDWIGEMKNKFCD